MALESLAKDFNVAKHITMQQVRNTEKSKSSMSSARERTLMGGEEAAYKPLVASRSRVNTRVDS